MTSIPKSSKTDTVSRQTKLLHALPLLMTEVERCLSPQAAFEACLFHSGDVLGCAGGLAYLPSPDSKHLILSCAYMHRNWPGFKDVRRLSQVFIVGKQPDLPGTVLLKGTPQWMENYQVADPATHPRIAAGIDQIVTVIGIPVIIYGKVNAVLEFIYTESVKEDETILSFLQCVAACVGMVLLRCYMKETLMQQQEKFKRNMEDKIINLLEAKGRAEEAATSKTEFLANISHELRTPMHAIMSYSELGLKKVEQGDKEKLLKYFNAIHDSGERLMNLLNNLLDLSKLESGIKRMDFARHDLRAIVHTVSTELWPLMQNKKLTLDIIESPKVKTIAEVDKFKISQVLLNLLSNAIKFSPERSTITINFAPVLWHGDAGDTPAISVMVIDEGIGIPPGEEGTVFDKFIQSSKTKTGAGGTGLGLAICKEIINAHQGVIFAEENVEKGATLVFQIPLKQPVRPND